MGTYLSTPVTVKGEESGETSQLAWGVVDMQGWRKNMEDAHVAQTDVDVPPHLFAPDDDVAERGKVFGVFDGHGGPEVARFCQLYIVSVLTQQPTWCGDEVDDMSGNVVQGNPANTPVGQALIQAFHAMDRLINDPLRRDEIIRLRAEKPMPGEHRLAQYVPSPFIEEFEASTDGGYDSIHPVKDSNEASENSEIENDVVTVVQKSVETPTETVVIEHENGVTQAEPSLQPSGETAHANETIFTTVTNESEMIVVEETISESAPGSAANESVAPADAPARSAVVESESAVSIDQPPFDKKEESAVEAKGKPDPKEAEDENDEGKDDDSNEAVGKDEASDLDQDMMDGDSGETSDTELSTSTAEEESSSSNSPRGKVTVMFQKLLSRSGQVVVNVVRDKGAESDSESDSSQQQKESKLSINSNPNAAGGTISRPSAANPTIIHNGRQICNLPDHPIHAGCTAVVAVLIGRTLTVANAGDSRAVLCRAGGRVEALSFDHKPLQEREMIRITNAGGFVNQFGRVNGNLNLSRSIGDLKYKQVPGIHPAGQMITAEPDIVQVKLDPTDEFFILGCDGIWDCLTNEQAVAYVRERIDTKTPTQIGVEMLDAIISEDPRASQGIGGDNMTVMIVDLLPHTRSHRSKAAS